MRKNSDCDKTHQKLHDYVSQELTKAESAGVEQHLLVCGDCAQRFRFWRQFRQSVRRAGAAVTARDSLRQAISANLRQAALEPGYAVSWGRLGPLALAAAVLMVMGLAFLLGHREGTGPGPVAHVEPVAPTHLQTVDKLLAAVVGDHDLHGNDLAPKDDETLPEQQKVIEEYKQALHRSAPRLPQLTVDGFSREQCHLCPVLDTHIPHILYRAGDKSVSLFLLTMNQVTKYNQQLATLPDGGMASSSVGDESLLAWKHHGLVYVLISRESGAMLVQIAADMARTS